MQPFNGSNIVIYASTLFLVYLAISYGVYHLVWKKRKHRTDSDGNIGMLLGFFAGTWVLLYFLGIAAFVLAGSFKGSQSAEVNQSCKEKVTQLAQNQKTTLDAYRNFENKDTKEARAAAQQYVELGVEIAKTLDDAGCK